MFSIGGRSLYLLRYSPEGKASVPKHITSKTAQLFTTGAVAFAFGFFIWNVDNLLCESITNMKRRVGWPWAFLLEGHSWWHALTGLGSYFMQVGDTCTYCFPPFLLSISLLAANGMACIVSTVPQTCKFQHQGRPTFDIRSRSRRMLCFKDSYKNYTIQYFLGLPYVHRVAPPPLENRKRID